MPLWRSWVESGGGGDGAEPGRGTDEGDRLF